MQILNRTKSKINTQLDCRFFNLEKIKINKSDKTMTNKQKAMYMHSLPKIFFSNIKPN